MIASYTIKGFPEKIKSGVKKHTFRRDPKRRWKVGMTVHHWWNNPRNRPKNQPKNRNPHEIQQDEVTFVWHTWIFVLESTQELMIYLENEDVLLKLTKEQVLIVAKNDGFESVGEFQDFFVPKPGDTWVGRLICWTDLDYFKEFQA